MQQKKIEEKANKTLDAIDRATAPDSKRDKNLPLTSFQGVFVVDEYLNKTLKDPSSLQIIECSPIITVEKGKRYSVSYKYRAKNSFNGYVVIEVIFYINGHNQITGFMDITNGVPKNGQKKLVTPFGRAFN